MMPPTHKFTRRRFLPIVLSLVVGCAAAFGASDAADRVADLIRPEKLATLGPRKANPRVQKAVAQLEAARKNGLKVEVVASNAVLIAGYTNAAAPRWMRPSFWKSLLARWRVISGPRVDFSIWVAEQATSRFVC